MWGLAATSSQQVRTPDESVTRYSGSDFIPESVLAEPNESDPRIARITGIRRKLDRSYLCHPRFIDLLPKERKQPPELGCVRSAAVFANLERLGELDLVCCVTVQILHLVAELLGNLPVAGLEPGPNHRS